MDYWFYFLLLFSLLALIIFFQGLNKAVIKNQSYCETPLLGWVGIFVWADALIFGLFWSLVSLVCFFLKNWYLFWLITGVFWLVRSFGETIYWLNQQFSSINRNPPEKLWLYRYLKSDAVWVVYQIFWQTISIVSLVTIIFLVKTIFIN